MKIGQNDFEGIQSRQAVGSKCGEGLHAVKSQTLICLATVTEILREFWHKVWILRVHLFWQYSNSRLKRSYENGGVRTSY